MSGNLVEKIKATSDDKQLDIICEDIVYEIKKGKIKFVEVVAELGEFLTNKDVSQREHGIQILSTILSKLPKDFLNENELQPITLFYCDRLKDHFSIIPFVVLGINNIVEMDNLPEDAPFKFLTAFFRDIQCQRENPRTRRIIYSIFDTLLTTRSKDLQKMGPDFVYGFISSIDGEADPSSLHSIFKIIPKILKEFTLGHLTEEMFDTIACYFPIDFKTEGKDGTKITRNELVAGLETCLSSIPEFAEFCLPLIIEKLDSDVKTAKLDSLHLLERSAPIYGAKALAQHPDLWPTMRKDILLGNDEEIKTTALNTVTKITRVLTNDEVILKEYIDKIVNDTKWSLCNTVEKEFWPAEKLLESVGKASELALRHVLKIVVPICLGQYSTKTSDVDKICLLETINNFMAFAASIRLKISDIPELAWTDLPSLYLTELSLKTNEYAVKSKALDGLVIQKLSLSENQRKIVYDQICQEIDGGNKIIKESCHAALTTFAQLYAKEVVSLVHGQLKVYQTQEITILKNRLEALTAIVEDSDLGPQILPIFVQLIVLGTPDITLAALICLERLLNTEKNNFTISHYLYRHCNVIEQLLNANIERNYSKNVQYLISSVFCFIIRRLTKEEQRNIINKHISLLKTDVEKNILLLEGILTPLMPINISTVITDILDIVIEVSLKSSDQDTTISFCRLISVIINKYNDEKELEKYLNVFEEKIKMILEADNENINANEVAVILHTWITKALITRGNEQSQKFLDCHINMLRNRKIGKTVGRGFKIFVDRNEKSLIVENYCTIKIFYKQRILQSILASNSTFQGDVRLHYLIALISFVEEIPLELIFLHLKKLAPLLIESLSLDNFPSILSTLKILKILLNTKNNIFIAQIQSFILRCLNLSTYPEMNVRIAALDCLTSYCDYPVVVIKPYKDNVLEKLSETIDDKKRLVRQMAVTARTRWFLVGAPGAPE